MNIKAISIEQISQDETTRVWFDVDGEEYAIAHSGPFSELLDSEGYPIGEQNDHSNIKSRLEPLYEKVAIDFCGKDCSIDEDYEL